MQQMSQAEFIGSLVVGGSVLLAFVKVIVTPLIKLNVSINGLHGGVERMNSEFCRSITENTEQHKEIVAKLDENGRAIAEHTTEISVIKTQIGSFGAGK